MINKYSLLFSVYNSLCFRESIIYILEFNEVYFFFLIEKMGNLFM